MFQYNDLKLPDLEKMEKNRQFNIILYFSVALNVEFNIIHILKFIHATSAIQVFFPLRFIFCVAIMSEKHKQNRGVTNLVSLQKDNKGTILASNDNFARRDCEG